MSYRQSVSAAGTGILVIQPLVVPAIATTLSLLLFFEQAIPIAFAGEVWGVFIRSDLLHLREFLSIKNSYQFVYFVKLSLFTKI